MNENYITNEMLETILNPLYKTDSLNEEAIGIFNTIGKRIFKTFKYIDNKTAEKCFRAGIENMNINWKLAYESKHGIFTSLCELFKRGAASAYSKK